MRKIASPRELVAELQRLLDYAQSRRPSRIIMAKELKALSTKLEPFDASKDYKLVKVEAQRAANRTGYDYGIRLNKLFKTWSYQPLLRVDQRFGEEARMEVVSCDDLSRCKPGHGPDARASLGRR